jgi:GT2 family glycosyltransferase
MQNLPKVSIITVNYNGEEVTCDMLESLRFVSYPNVEVIVVDNASARDCSVIAERFPEVKLIRSKKNLGFAGGNNLGIKEATGDYILMLNNDTIVPTTFLEPMVETFLKNKNVGIVSPKIIFYYSEGLVQYAGTGKISRLTCRGATNGYMQKDNGQFNYEASTELSHGACMMISREAINKVGLLDETYFMFYEEYDYCERVKQAGFEIFYNGKSYILHKQSITVGKNSPLKSYYMFRSRIYFMRKNFTGISKALSVLYVVAIAMPKNFLSELFKGRMANSSAIFRGTLWNLSH